MLKLIDQVSEELAQLKLSSPKLGWVYHPLRYAREPHHDYVKRYGQPTKREVLFLGINPGPWGMAQTGVPFGDVPFVRDWLKVSGHVGEPDNPCAKRPIEGFSLTRREGSGKRLWGWARSRAQTPEAFFARAFVWNYCPLLFLERESARNLTPDRLVRDDQDALYEPCDRLLRAWVERLEPKLVVGVGNFALERIEHALKDHPVARGKILHPSPASPQANAGWEQIVEAQLKELGFQW